ncbi:hypothetical protein [Cloacibacillus sp. An23]|uniref:hypothetical protein n=1 Tax=Cloacibacillus sp. An23 TaxID=1965591 RepID=UPI000B37A38A|nr:hypothetical protein [Cloacibacillus sp. An23]OUO95015.1 hypothetical protein B5F39_00320 [Cloacibacillus sp. An23]
MKNFAAGRAELRAWPRKKRGFTLIYVLAASTALLSLLALALDSSLRLAEERAEAARALRIGNVSAQASAAAEAWFAANAAQIAASGGFSPDAAPADDPTPDVPDGIFDALRAENPRYVIKCACYDLHYPDSFSERAGAAGIPRVAPFVTEDGGAVRAYYIRTTVSEAGNEKYERASSVSMRVKKSASGVITVHRTGVTE